MKKFLIIFSIFFLILITSLIKNSTKSIDDEIFVTKEKIRDLEKEYENIQLEHDYLSSSEKLYEYQNLYFDNELIKKDIQKMKIIKKRLNKLEINQLELFDEK